MIGRKAIIAACHEVRAGCLEVRAGCLEVSCASLSILGVFLALPTETNFTTPHYYPKYEVWAIEFFLL